MNTALVLAGGTGTRLGSDIPKQYIKVNGKMIIDYCLKTLDESEYIDAIWIVADSLWQDKIKLPEKFRGFSLPGDNRQLSIYNGINDIYAFECNLHKNSDMLDRIGAHRGVCDRAVSDEKVINSSSDIVLIHDAARPNLTEAMIQECMNAVRNDGYDGAMPVLPMKDTVYMSSDGKKIDSLIDRSTVYAGQAPEVFVLDKYIQANKVLMPDRILSINGSSEPAVMAGMNIALVHGDENNYKITTKADLKKDLLKNVQAIADWRSDRMKAQVLHDVADLRYEEVSKPQLKKGWVLVKVKAAGVCGSDIPRIYKTGAHVHPLIPGHEFSGQVVDIYDESSAEWLGKKGWRIPAYSVWKMCFMSKKQYEMCKDYNYLGSRCDGGFAEYVAVPEWNLIELPDNVTYEQAAMMEPMSVAVHAIRQFDGLIRNGQKADNTCDYIKDKSVCIIGLGTIGLLLTMFLIDAGIKNIYVICNKMAQKEQALELGIPEDNIVVEAEKEKNIADRSAISMGLKEYDYVFECVGRQETVCRAIELAAPAAHIVVVGNPYSDMSFSKDIYWKLLRYQLKLGGTWNSSYTKNDSDDWHYVLGRLQKGSIHPEKLITHRYSLEDIHKGMEIMRDKTEDYVKVMLYEF